MKLLEFFSGGKRSFEFVFRSILRNDRSQIGQQHQFGLFTEYICSSSRYPDYSPKAAFSMVRVSMKHLLLCTLESPRRDITITSSRHLYSEYRITTCGESRKSYLDITRIWNQHMARAHRCGGYSNKMSCC